MSVEVWRDCQNRTIQTCLTNRLFIQLDWLFMQKPDRWGIHIFFTIRKRIFRGIGEDR